MYLKMKGAEVNTLPKVLIISRGVWDDSQGTSSTLTNIFEDYNPKKLAHIYIETKKPNTHCCYRFFQISEASLIHRIYNKRIQTGHVIDVNTGDVNLVNESVQKEEERVMGFVRRHRSVVFSWARELLWAFNGWKNDGLKQFILSFNPDVVWLDGSPLPLMNRLSEFVLRMANKPAVVFMQDDVYTKKSQQGGFLRVLYRRYLRRTVDRVVALCSGMFVASPKMKQEYDELFGLDSVFIAKSFQLPEKETLPQTHQPIRLVYLGQIIYGRIKTLISVSNAVGIINKEKDLVQFSIYTNNHISDKQRAQLLKNKNVFIKDVVPYSEVPRVIAENDVVVFVETFDPKQNRLARLSFSTKISDYLRSGKCVFAVGPSDIAPIEYFINEDAALVATDEESILGCIKQVVNPSIVREYAKKANACVRKNHDRNKMNEIVYDKLTKIAFS